MTAKKTAVIIGLLAATVAAVVASVMFGVRTISPVSYTHL